MMERTQHLTTKRLRPTKADLEAARDRIVPDLIAADLKVLFCGINPGLYSGAVGHHFARPGNRFWPALYRGGITERQISPFDERELLARGYGITNIVPRTTATADELTRDELETGGRALVRKIHQHKPRIVAFLGLTAYRIAFDVPKATVGPQDQTIGASRIWILPNPSGLNAHYQIADLGRLLAELRQAAESHGD